MDMPQVTAHALLVNLSSQSISVNAAELEEPHAGEVWAYFEEGSLASGAVVGCCSSCTGGHCLWQVRGYAPEHLVCAGLLPIKQAPGIKQ